MSQVTKAVIPAAGLGTRFLPATKAQPKEMLPIVDKPAIQYIVEEAAQAGIEDIIIVTGRGKRAIEDHFDKAYELEEVLKAKKQEELLYKWEETICHLNIHYIRQKEPLGLGHAIFCARKFIGQEPFAVMLGDDVVLADKPCLGQLMEIYAQYHSSIVGVQEIPDEDIGKYGIIHPGSEIEKGLFKVYGFVEKPSVQEAPSNLAIMGRYILRPEIFAILENISPGRGGEIQLTDALEVLNRQQAVLGYSFYGKRYDVGDKLGLIKANIEFALLRPEMRYEVLEFINSVINSNIVYGRQK